MEAWFDGGSRGNPGIAGSGWVLKRNNIILQAGCVFVGTHATNNQAEYAGLIAALEAAIANNASHLSVFGDSLLVIQQIQGNWQVKDPKMKLLHASARKLVQQFERVTFTHVLRHLNKEADMLSNLAMDTQRTQMGVDLFQIKDEPVVPSIYSGPTCAVRIKRENGRVVQDCDVWVGAAWTKGGWRLARSEWCNPFAAITNREESLKAYKQYIRTQPQLASRIESDLKGRRLGCFCDPSDPTCHAVWLSAVAEDVSLLAKN